MSCECEGRDLVLEMIQELASARGYQLVPLEALDREESPIDKLVAEYAAMDYKSLIDAYETAKKELEKSERLQQDWAAEYERLRFPIVGLPDRYKAKPPAGLRVDQMANKTRADLLMNELYSRISELALGRVMYPEDAPKTTQTPATAPDTAA